MVERLKNSTDQGKTLEATKKKCCKQRKKKQRDNIYNREMINI